MKESASRARQSTGEGGTFHGDKVAGKIEKCLAPAKSITCQLV
jgi:hypothetical protein